MRRPQSWPVAVNIFLLVAIGSIAFPAFLAFKAGWPLEWYLVPVVVLAAGIAFLASRICWWVLLLFAGVALTFTASRFISGSIEVAEIGWPSWITIFLQSLLMVTLVTPGMVRWIAPFGRAKMTA